jgi:hypothetical protein
MVAGHPVRRRFGLQALEGVYFGLEVVEVGDDAMLFGERGDWNLNTSNTSNA